MLSYSSYILRFWTIAGFLQYGIGFYPEDTLTGGRRWFCREVDQRDRVTAQWTITIFHAISSRHAHQIIIVLRGLDVGHDWNLIYG